MKKIKYMLLTLIQMTIATHTEASQLNKLQDFQKLLQSDILTADNCLKTLKDAQNVYNINDLKSESTLDHKELIQMSFENRLALRTVFKKLHNTNQINGECISEFRKLFQSSRLFEEYIAEANGISEKEEVFSQNFPYFLQNPAFMNSELKSGDILMSRGNAVVSAAIAKFGEEEGLFSHLAIVYVDPRTKEIFIIQSEMETGTEITPISKYKLDGKLRVVVFRYENGSLAEAAAEAIFQKVKNAENNGEKIPFNFGMDLNNSNEYFCSQLVFDAFQMASNEKFHLAPHRSVFTKQSDGFLESIGVQTRNSFAPNDMELDPRFEIVSEWRDFSATTDARIKDSILATFFDWMKNDQYEFHTNIFEDLFSNFAWILRRWPIFGSILEDQFPTNMKSSAISTFLAMSASTGPLIEILTEQNKIEIKKVGVPLSYENMKKNLESIRKEDLIRQKNWNEWNNKRQMNPESSWQEPERPLFLDHFHNN